jgi:hypothetical protein
MSHFRGGRNSAGFRRAPGEFFVFAVNRCLWAFDQNLQ